MKLSDLEEKDRPIERYSMVGSAEWEWGKEQEFIARFTHDVPGTISIERLMTNTPGPGVVRDFALKVGPCIVYECDDGHVTTAHKDPVLFNPPIEIRKNETIIMRGVYTGIVPPGWLEGRRFIFVTSLRSLTTENTKYY